MNKDTYLARVINNMADPMFPYWTAGIYGFKRWISRYGYYPSFLPLCIYTDHGPGASEDHPSWDELASDAPVQFYHCSEVVERWKKQSKKECHILHSPFVFARKSLKISSAPDRAGSIFFAAHATSVTLDINPIDIYIKELESIPDKYKPIKICLYFNEVLLGHDEVYRKEGYETVTAGDTEDQDFTEKFYKILSTAKYVLSNTFGSYALYAVEMGVPFGLYGTNPRYFNIEHPDIEYGEDSNYMRFVYFQQAAALFNGLPGEQVTVEQAAFARRYLGVDDGVSRLKMACILYRSFGIWLWRKFRKLVSRS